MTQVQPLFESVDAWLSYMRRLPARDLDNVVLFDGDPGNGKSTVAAQVGRALDPLLSVRHIHFRIPAYIDDARELEAGRAIVGDEWLMNRRKGMSNESKQVVDFFQVNRGLNLHHLICFPEATRLDLAMQERVRWRVTVSNPLSEDQEWREAIVAERRTRRVMERGEERAIVSYRYALSFRFYRNSGPWWEDYLAKKLLEARMRDAEARGVTLEQSVDEETGEGWGSRRTRLAREGRGSRIEFRVRETSPLAPIFAKSEPRAAGTEP